MMIFFLLTLFALVGTACFVKVVFFSIQPDQWIDQLFDYQNKLEKMGQKTGAWNTILYKAGGACAFCFAHALSLLCFVVFAIITCSNGFWPCFETTFGQWAFNVGWYCVFTYTSTVFSSLLISRT